MSMMEGVYPMNKNLRRLAEPGATIHMFVLVAFAVATLLFGLYELAAIEAGVILLLVVIVGVIVFALVQTGGGKAMGTKIGRNLRELTGGLVGKRKEEDP